MAKKRASKAESTAPTARKLNPDAAHRLGIVLTRDLVSKLKLKAYESGVTLQKYASDILTKHLEK